MCNFNDLENILASFSDKFENSELKLFLYYFKNLDFDYLNKIENLENFIENFILNDTLIFKKKDFLNSGFSEKDIIFKTKFLILVNAKF
ncbi:hypothetical protein [uncultured Clostridium sp.]|uniref:hypothetical protein n=1 Tax=uncultured Clostridium sp. TaxID=59620 RepID=UPI0025D44B25|nr:hypothetical protein [uncultured Clostridium sp.]